DNDLVALWTELAWRSTAQGDLTQAAQLLTKVVKKRPDDLASRQQLFDVAARQKDAAVMRQAIEHVTRIAEGSPMWHCDQAQLLEVLAESSSNSKLQCQQALEHLKLAAAQWPRSSQVALLTAAAFDRQGNIEAALENYEKAIELGELRPTAVR